MTVLVTNILTYECTIQNIIVCANIHPAGQLNLKLTYMYSIESLVGLPVRMNEHSRLIREHIASVHVILKSRHLSLNLLL